MYDTIDDLLKLAESDNAPLWKPILRNETRITGLSEEKVFQKLDERFQIMSQSAVRALQPGLLTAGGLIEGIASTHYAYASGNGGICGSLINEMMAFALSCSEANASMGKICAAPTAGACGILPAVLIAVGNKFSLKHRAVLEGLLTASGIGAIITRNATVSGAEGGCQAECGVAAAMAAAAAVQMARGTSRASVNAICFALMNCMGLICDPVAGLVQIPCAQRNASQAVNALLCADLALAGMPSVIPPDQVVAAMLKVGKQLPMQLRETTLGGIAATPAANEISVAILGNQQKIKGTV